MLSSSVRQIIATTFSTFADQFSNKNCPFDKSQGALFTVRISHSFYGYDQNDNFCPELEKHIDKFCHIIILSNRRVFFACEDNANGRPIYNWQKIPTDKWINTSNHKSCWREDGFVMMDKVASSAYDSIANTLPENVDASAIYSHISLGVNMSHEKIMEFVQVEEDLSTLSQPQTKLKSVSKLKTALSVL